MQMMKEGRALLNILTATKEIHKTVLSKNQRTVLCISATNLHLQKLSQFGYNFGFFAPEVFVGVYMPYIPRTFR